MFERKLMISGLRRQRQIIDELILSLEKTPCLDSPDFFHYERTSRQLIRNLNRLRKIKADYQTFLYTDFTNTSNTIDT
ncbi:MAG: hypothetical protein HYZ85_01860 [Candidatus Omnitrophica bacterium]|nr:hypothetical protein [Candidatus Omnitrophota bacterium]